MELRLLVLPVVGALIGWFTNYLAVKMLFRPRRPIRVLGITLQGLVPRRRSELARSVGEVVERELVSHDDVRKVLSDEQFLASLRPRLDEQIDNFLRKRVVRDSALLRAAFSTAVMMKLKEIVADELMSSLPDIVEGMVEGLEERLRFRELVEQKIEQFELERLEETVTDVAGKELAAIELLGGLIGLAVGLVQMVLLTFL